MGRKITASFGDLKFEITHPKEAIVSIKVSYKGHENIEECSIEGYFELLRNIVELTCGNINIPWIYSPRYATHSVVVFSLSRYLKEKTKSRLKAFPMIGDVILIGNKNDIWEDPMAGKYADTNKRILPQLINIPIINKTGETTCSEDNLITTVKFREFLYTCFDILSSSFAQDITYLCPNTKNSKVITDAYQTLYEIQNVVNAIICLNRVYNYNFTVKLSKEQGKYIIDDFRDFVDSYGWELAAKNIVNMKELN